VWHERPRYRDWSFAQRLFEHLGKRVGEVLRNR
jgi:hypothetical protein